MSNSSKFNNNYEFMHLAKSRFTEILQPAKVKINGYQSYICPLCGNGSGSSGDGIVTRDGINYKCFVCNFYGDIFNYIAERDNIDECEIFNYVYNMLGIGTSNKDNNYSDLGSNILVSKNNILNDISEFFNLCTDEIKYSVKAQNYLNKRGISLNTALDNNVGYCENWKYPFSNSNIYSSRIIFFTDILSLAQNTNKATLFNDISYTALDINAIDKKYRVMKVGSSRIFDPVNILEYINSDDDDGNTNLVETIYIFVVEGEFDALSLFEIGEIAIALGSSSNYLKFLNYVKDIAELKNNTPIKFIISLDNDNAGYTTTSKILKELNVFEYNNIVYTNFNISGEYKDPNEHLQNDKNNFIKFVDDSKKSFNNFNNNIETFNIESNKQNFSYTKDLFKQNLESYSTGKYCKTGFKLLDEKMNGFYSGLYIIGAISSIGKTTFIHQLTEQMVLNNSEELYQNKVIYFSLEQSEAELISKSIARRNYIYKKDISNINKKINTMSNTEFFYSSLDIRSGAFQNSQDKELLKAIDFYDEKIQPYYNIVSGNFNFTIEHIINYIKDYILKNQTKPIIVIDYLQIIQSSSLNSNNIGRDMIDYNLIQLKKLSLQYGIIIIIISSLNRSNYMNTISFESFKESGSIEYSSDVVFGLQFKIFSNSLFEKKSISEKRIAIEKAKIGFNRELELVCLKNRFGVSGYTIPFNYYPAYDLFTENTQKIEKSKKGNII